MSYLALARKYRPQTFDELIGQEFVSTSLKNAIDLGRVSHAYLFTGARGVGKTSAARIMAKALNCLHPVDNNPCNECENCLEITEGTSIDVVEIDGASNRGVDEIRQLREAVKFIPVKYKYKVYIVDEVHMLTDAASNALLKTLEEPPSYVVFIFATTDAHKIMPTILSRCQRYDFKKIPFDSMKEALVKIFRNEKVEYDVNALNLIIRQSEGCMRDALSFSDQVISYTNGNVTYETVAQMMGVSEDPVIGDLYASVLREDKTRLEDLIWRLCDTGVSLTYATEKMVTHTRNLLFMQTGGGSHIKKELTSEENDYYTGLLKDATEHRLFALFQLLQKLYTDIKYSSFPRYTFEFGLYKAASLSGIVPLPVNGETPPRQISVEAPARAASPRTPEKAVENAAIRPQKQEPEQPVVNKTYSLTTLEKRWNELLKELQAEAPGLAAALQHGTLLEYGSGKVVIVFPKERMFQYTRSVQTENQKTLKAFLNRKLGEPVELEIKNTENEKKKPLIDKKNELESLYEKQLKKEVSELPVMRHLIDLFGINDDNIRVIKRDSEPAQNEN